MKHQVKRNAYFPPIAVDLSKSGVLGQEQPEGVCGSGNIPYINCTVGPQVNNVGECQTGNAVGSCTPGSYVTEDPQCKVGSWAVTGCKAGTSA